MAIGDARTEREARERQPKSQVRRWWSIIQRQQSSAEGLTEEEIDEVIAASKDWGFAECSEAITLIDIAAAGMQITGSIAGRLQAGIRLRQAALAAGLLAPNIPDCVLVPYLGAELQCHPADITDDLRVTVEPVF